MSIKELTIDLEGTMREEAFSAAVAALGKYDKEFEI